MCLSSEAPEHIQSERSSIFLQPLNSLQVTITFPSTPSSSIFFTSCSFASSPLPSKSKTNQTKLTQNETNKNQINSYSTSFYWAVAENHFLSCHLNEKREERKQLKCAFTALEVTLFDKVSLHFLRTDSEIQSQHQYVFLKLSPAHILTPYQLYRCYFKCFTCLRNW